MSTMGAEEKEKIISIREKAKSNGSKLREIIGSHSISCAENLFIMYFDKGKTFTWNFNVLSSSATHISLRRVYLLDDHLPEYSLDSVNINSILSRLPPTCQLWENHAKVNFISFQIMIRFYSENYGAFEQGLVFEFENGDTVVRRISIQVSQEYRIMSALYFNPLKEAENELLWIQKYDIVPFDGEPEICFKASKNRLPPNIEDFVSYGAFDYFDKKLDKENYKARLHLLLHIEEYQRRKEIQQLSFEIPKIRGCIHEPIPGLHQNPILKLPAAEFVTEQTCQLIGKSGKALIKVTNLVTQEVRVYEVLLEQVLSNQFVLELSSKFTSYIYQCMDPLKADLCFRFVDVFQYMHQAIDNVSLSDVFPVHQSAKYTTWNSFQHPKLSKDQSIAFNEMVRPGPGPPVLVLGPFGSGKTRTLATCILELMESMESGKADYRILICTHSNSAADHYIEDFIHPFLQTRKSKEDMLIRVNWEHRYTASVSRTVFNYCEVKNGKFVQPSKEEIERHRVVVCTLVTADILFQSGISRDHFTHIFIDEAAQAMEVEAIIPLALKGDNTKVILAGDHLQLGPYLSSSTAKNLGLGVSLLERLFQEYPDGTPCKLKLLENYRSFKEIVEISSALFYEGALLSHKTKPPGLKYPLRFFGIHGKETLSRYHPSYFNVEEANEVLFRIKALLDDWPKELGALEAAKICVLCCFAAQIQEIRLVLRRNGLSNVRVENVSNVQGLEFDVVILSTVRSYKVLCTQKDRADLGFLSNPKLLNTAITRAKYLCIFIGEPVALCSFGACKACWKTVLASCQKQGEFHYRLDFDSVLEISDRLRETLNLGDDTKERAASLKAVFENEAHGGRRGVPRVYEASLASKQSDVFHGRSAAPPLNASFCSGETAPSVADPTPVWPVKMMPSESTPVWDSKLGGLHMSKHAEETPLSELPACPVSCVRSLEIKTKIIGQTDSKPVVTKTNGDGSSWIRKAFSGVYELSNTEESSSNELPASSGPPVFPSDALISSNGSSIMKPDVNGLVPERKPIQETDGPNHCLSTAPWPKSPESDASSQTVSNTIFASSTAISNSSEHAVFGHQELHRSTEWPSITEESKYTRLPASFISASKISSAPSEIKSEKIRSAEETKYAPLTSKELPTNFKPGNATATASFSGGSQNEDPEGFEIPANAYAHTTSPTTPESNLVNVAKSAPIAIIDPMPTASTYTTATIAQPPRLPNMVPLLPGCLPPQFQQYRLPPGNVIPQFTGPNLYTFVPIPHSSSVPIPRQAQPYGNFTPVPMINVPARPQIATVNPMSLMGPIPPANQAALARVQCETAKLFVNDYAKYIINELFPDSDALLGVLRHLQNINSELEKFVYVSSSLPVQHSIQKLHEYKGHYLNGMRTFDQYLTTLLPHTVPSSTLADESQCDAMLSTLYDVRKSLECSFQEVKSIIPTRDNLNDYNTALMLQDNWYSSVLFVQTQLEENIRPLLKGSSTKSALLYSIKLKFVSKTLAVIQNGIKELNMLIENAKQKQLKNDDSSSSSLNSDIQERLQQFFAEDDPRCGFDSKFDNPSKVSSPGKCDSPGKYDSPGQFNSPGKCDSPSKFNSPGKYDSPGKFNSPGKSSAGSSEEYLVNNGFVHQVPERGNGQVFSRSKSNSFSSNSSGGFSKSGPESDRKSSNSNVDSPTNVDVDSPSRMMEKHFSKLLSMTDDDNSKKLSSEVGGIQTLIKHLRISDSDVDEWFVDRASDPFVKDYIASFERQLAGRLPSPQDDPNNRPPSPPWVIKYRITPRYQPYSRTIGNFPGPYNTGVFYFECSSTFDKPIGVVLSNGNPVYFYGLEAINRALIGDEVCFALIDTNPRHLKGRVLKVQERGNWSLLCKVSLMDRNLMIPSDEKGPPIIVTHAPKDDADSDRSVVRSSVRKFIIRVIGWPLDLRYPVGVIEKQVDLAT